MRAIEAGTFSGYGGLRQVELPSRNRQRTGCWSASRPPASPRSIARSWQEWLLARPEDVALVPDAIDDIVATSLPVAYLTAQITLTLAGFKPDLTVLAPAIGGSVGNATYQVARAQGAGKVISTAGSAAKAAKARELGFEDVIDLTTEGLADGVRRITAGKGVAIVIESIGGTVTSEALSSLSLGGVLITLGYSAGRKTTIDVTDLIWKGTRMAGFSLFAQSPIAIATAWRDIIPLVVADQSSRSSSGSIPSARPEKPCAI